MMAIKAIKMSRKSKELEVVLVIKPIVKNADWERRREEAADHIIKFVYERLEKKFPMEKLHCTNPIKKT